MAPDLPLPSRIEQCVQAEMKAGEKLIWAAMPKPISRLAWLGGAMLMVLAAIVFAWWGNHNRSAAIRAHAVFPIYIVPFLFLAVLMLLAPLIIRTLGTWTLYVLTDRRAIILRGSRFNSASAESYMPDRLQEMSLVEKDDKSGDLIFARFPGLNGTTSNRGFLEVANVREVDRLIRSALHAKHLME